MSNLYIFTLLFYVPQCVSTRVKFLQILGFRFQYDFILKTDHPAWFQTIKQLPRILALAQHLVIGVVLDFW